MQGFGLVRAWLLLMMGAGVAHAPGQERARLAFDVATIRESKPDSQGGIKALPGGNGYTAHNVPVKLMISLMYKIPMRQIKGGPEWLNGAHYDVEAKVDGQYNLDDLHGMYQNLLADRFGLKFHMESREGPVYLMTVEKGGTKMRVNETAQDFKIPLDYTGIGAVECKRVGMEYFSWWLGQQLDRTQRPVLDRTGLKGNWDFELKFLPELPVDFPKENLPQEVQDRPSLPDAVREQLGLRLTADKGPVPYMVIDSVERPSAN